MLQARNSGPAKKITAELEKAGVLFESKKLKDTQLPGFISSYLKRKQVEIEPKASEMMAEFVGTDLNRMAGELEKLIITLPAGQNGLQPNRLNGTSASVKIITISN